MSKAPHPDLSAAPRPNRTWLYVGLGFVVLWAAYLRFFGPGGGSGYGPRLQGSGLAEPADYAWTPRDLKGNDVPFSTFRGKTVFLNVWATWCGPCVGEMPSIAKLAADPKLKDVAFVCVSVDDHPESVKSFLASRGEGWTMTVLHAKTLPKVFTTTGIPATFLIAPDGKIAASEVGSADWSDPAVSAFLLRLAASPAKSLSR